MKNTVKDNPAMSINATTALLGTAPNQMLARVGSPIRKMMKTAKSLPADLIVISIHGRAALKHVFLGSVAGYVVQGARCPVLRCAEARHEIIAS